MVARTYSEKRGFIRLPVECEITMQHAVNGKQFVATGKNLSASGVLFHTDELLTTGEQLDMHIDVSQGLVSVFDARIEVIRVEELAPTQYAVASVIRALHDS